MTLTIENERPEDFRIVEELIKRAFWNVNFPGCNEHYLAHHLRTQKDFVPELDFVLKLNEQIIASIMYTKSRLVDENGNEKTVLTFGPLGVLPEYQRRGYGKRLLEYSLEKATELGYEAVVIFGNPENYVSSGFKSCKKYNVSLDNGEYPVPLLVNELKESALSGKSGRTRKVPHTQSTPRALRILTRILRKWKRAGCPVRNCFTFTVIRVYVEEGC